MEQEEIAEEMEQQENQLVRVVTYLPASTYAWAMNNVERLANLDRLVSLSELIRDAVHHGAKGVDKEITTISEMRDWKHGGPI